MEKKKSSKMILVIALIVLIIVATVAAMSRGVAGKTENSTVTTEPTALPEVTEEPAEPEISVPALDSEKLFALYDENETVMTVDGSPVSWAEYYYWINYNLQYMNHNAQSAGMSYTLSEETGLTEGQTFSEMITGSIAPYVVQLHVIDNFVKKDHGINLSDESKEAIDQATKQNMLDFCGENATDEDFDAALKELFMTRSVYNYINEMNQLYVQAFTDIYGINGANVSDEDTIQFLENNGYMYAAHILFRNTSKVDNSELDKEILAQRLILAYSIADELRAISDPEKRLEKFYSYMNEYSEDTGTAYYPTGYIFTTGEMVPQFEEAVRALDEYEVSQPVESDYGYHIIVRLPFDADAIMAIASSGAQTARQCFAASDYEDQIAAKISTADVKYSENFKVPNLADYEIK